jgi:putative restriction endonuclease
VKYWWVNHNKTYYHEVGSGYLWSPKKKSNGTKNVFYDNMLSVEPGDLVLSFADTFIRAIGVATSNAYTSDKPPAFGSSGDYWSKDGWRVDVEFTVIEKPIKPKEHMSLIAPLLPERYAPLQKSGAGLQGVYLAELSDDLGQLLVALSGDPEITVPVMDLSQLVYNQEEQDLIAETALQDTAKASLIMARRGQGLFRNRVKLIEQKCRVTGVSSEKVLNASHIKPWKDSTNRERLEGNNGLFLSPHVDKLFDAGLITFTAKGEMWVSPQLSSEVLPKWKIDPNKKYGKFNSEQAYFLEFHNSETFKQSI